MDKFKAVIRTSEFWGAVALSLLAPLVQFGVVSQNTVDALAPYIQGAVSYILLRLTSKVAKVMVKP